MNSVLRLILADMGAAQPGYTCEYKTALIWTVPYAEIEAFCEERSLDMEARVGFTYFWARLRK